MKRGILIATVIIAALIGTALFIISSKNRPRNDSESKTGQSYQTGQEGNGQERKLVALGSSISKANNLSTNRQGDNDDFSFSTGTKIDSLFLALQGRGENLTAVNLASSGADTSNILAKQVPNALGYHPRYLTLDPGADIAIGVSLEQYRQNLSQIIKEIKKDDTIILMATYPNFARMRSANLSSCRENKVGVRLEDLTEQRVQTFNQAIKQLANQNQILLVDLYDILGPNDVSDYDCLHPNLEGQKKIARAFVEALK